MSHPDPYDYSLFNVEAADQKALVIADLIIDRWQAIASILTPIIGQREVTRLFERSIHLCNDTHPWMQGATGGFQDSMNLNDLQRSIAQQPAAIAAGGASLLLRTFHDLFADVVGRTVAGEVLPASVMKLPTPEDAT